jgi:hypothetical protein
MVTVLGDHFLMDDTGAMNADAQAARWNSLSIAEIALENLHRSSSFYGWQAQVEIVFALWSLEGEIAAWVISVKPNSCANLSTLFLLLQADFYRACSAAQGNPGEISPTGG